MEKLTFVELEELNRYIVYRDCFQSVLSIVNVDCHPNVRGLKVERTSPMRLNALIMNLVLEGTAKIRLDYLPYSISTNDFVTIMPTHVYQLDQVSDDYRAILLIASKDFFKECSDMGKYPSLVSDMAIRKNPCIRLEPEEAERLAECFNIIRCKMSEHTHFYQKEMVEIAFLAYWLELANIFIKKDDKLIKPRLNRKEELFERFVNLLYENNKEEHQVTFYANKLFITPQYLSLILKELTGKSANKWIDDALIMEAKMLLKAPQITVQQVADQLHFSDQSTFGKFFKKHMGISPMEYRRS